MTRSCALSLLFLLTSLLDGYSQAQVSQNLLSEDQPQWELGAGVITLNLPDYPGSNNNRIRAVPFPYYIYRGKYFRADDEGTRARLLASKRHETGFSLGFNFPVNSGDNPSREGMPDLDAIFSIGPRLLFRFLTDSSSHKINLSVAGRWVFSSKVSLNNLVRHEGYTIEPRFNYWYRWKRYEVTIFSSLGFEFGSARYASFFYNVNPDYETNTRPTYISKAGLIETSIAVGFGKVIDKDFFLFTGGSMRNLDWATNKSSPLVETKNNVGFLLGIVWTFYESENKVQRL